eukprot:scaffold3836_cov417-Prasinococcus_capsulatus_cf.AAC.4
MRSISRYGYVVDQLTAVGRVHLLWRVSYCRFDSLLPEEEAEWPAYDILPFLSRPGVAACTWMVTSRSGHLLDGPGCVLRFFE